MKGMVSNKKLSNKARSILTSRVWDYNEWCETNTNESIRNMYYILQYRNKMLLDKKQKIYGVDEVMVGQVSAAYLSLDFPYYLVLHEFYNFMYEKLYIKKEKYCSFTYSSYTEGNKINKPTFWQKFKDYFKWT
jgi:hypothetical protein